MILLFLLLQAPSFETHGRFNYSYKREETGDTAQPFRSEYWLHYGIIEFIFRPRSNLKLVYSNDFGGTSGYKTFFAELFVPRIRSNINVGLFKIPFGMEIKDHTSLLEDEIGLGIYHRSKLGVGVDFSFLLFNLKTGYFPTVTFGPKLYVSTFSIRLGLLDTGIGFLLDEYLTMEKQKTITKVNRRYYEYYAKLFIPFVPPKFSLFGKCIFGERYKHRLLGYSISIGSPMHLLFYPFIEYEFLDKKREEKEDAIWRRVIGVKSMIVHNVVLRIAHYMNYEEKEEKKNNLFSVMVIIWW